MVTYLLKGSGADRWLMFWEDVDVTPHIAKHRSSADFNDLVVEVTSHSQAVSVPLLPASYMGIATLLSGGIAKVLRDAATKEEATA